MEKLIKRHLSYKVKNIKVYVDTIEKPSGRTTDRIVIEYPEAVGILPILDTNEIIIVKQYRYAIKQDLFELPAGKIDPGEEIQEALRRELEEETGYTSKSFQKLITIAPASSYSSEILHLFVAKNLSKIDTPVDQDEIREVRIVSKETLMKQILENKIFDPLIALCLLLAEKKEYL